MVRKGLLLPFEAAGREDDESDDDEAEHDELGGRRALVEEEYAADEGDGRAGVLHDAHYLEGQVVDDVGV